MNTTARLLGLVRPYAPRLALAFVCMGVLALTTAAYAWLTGPLLAFLLTGGKAGAGPLQHLFPGLFDGLDPSLAAWALPGAMLAVALLKGLAYLAQFYLMGMVGQAVVADLRRAFLAKLVRLPPSFYEARHSGDLLSRFSSDVAAVELFATYGVASVLRDGSQLLVLLVLVFALDFRLALGALCVVPLLILPVARLARSLRKRVRAGQAALGKVAERVQEGLWGLRVIQAYGTGPFELSRFDRENGRYLTEVRRALRTRALTPALVELLLVAALATTLAVAARAVLAGALSPERLVSFVTAMALLYQPAKDLGRVSPWLLQATAGAERLFEVLDAPEPITSGTQVLPPVKHSVRLEGVGLAYGDRSVLRGLDLELKAGETLALVGESGGGKSTVVKLLLRFMDPSAGRVAIDGVDAREATLASVRAQFALVTQEPLLFNASVRDNLAYGRPGASQADLEAAAQAAGADAFIRALPQGYDTGIGERGVRLSGGQKQRLALARALVAQAPVLVLDEATSSLDPESEQAVQATLDALLVGRTALVIAHRFSAVRSATRVAVLKDGHIVETGTPAELLAKGGEFARLAQLQGARS